MAGSYRSIIDTDDDVPLVPITAYGRFSIVNTSTVDGVVTFHQLPFENVVLNYVGAGQPETKLSSWMTVENQQLDYCEWSND